MEAWKNKNVIVVGLGASGRAASRLLRRAGARVWALDTDDTPALRQIAESLKEEGIEVSLGAAQTLPEGIDSVVVSPGIPPHIPLMQSIFQQRVPILGELELGFRQFACPKVAITGTNGKTTTTELVEKLLTQAGKKTVAAGNIGLPLCEVALALPALDILTLEVSSFQLETINTFRSEVAILMNLTPDHLDRYASQEEYIRTKARLFTRQLPQDWAIIQKESLAQLSALNIDLPGRVVTFSGRDAEADLYFENEAIWSRRPEFMGKLLEMNQVRLRGVHNVENMMAAMAVALVWKLPMEAAVSALAAYEPAAHRCELVEDYQGLRFVNDSKATNVDAVRQALYAMPAAADGQPNIWLIAGGKDKGFEYDELGPDLAKKVKGAFLLGETQQKIKEAWQRFTPCMLVESLLEAVTEAAGQACAGEVILLSPACSSFDMFKNYQHRGELFRQAVRVWTRQQEEKLSVEKPSASGK